MAKISTQTSKDLFIHIGIIGCLFIAFFLAFFFVYLPWSTNHGQSITVPKLKDMKLADLEDYLDDRNLRMEVSDCVFVAGAEPLTVISHFPKEGANVKRRTQNLYYNNCRKSPAHSYAKGDRPLASQC